MFNSEQVAKRIRKDTEQNSSKEKLLFSIISFVIGAFVLSLFSIIQKIILHEIALIFKVQSYLIPVLYGGITGLLLGLWFLRLKEKEKELLDAYETTLIGWAKASEARDKCTHNHAERVVKIFEELAQAMDVSEKELVHMKRGALLHDIGKLGIPDAVLNKPGTLTEDEMEIMQQHPAHGKKMLEGIRFLRKAIEIPCCHHERWDGSGYPNGFKGEEIPLSARIFAVIDVWDALINDRPYRKAWTIEDATKYIEANAGKLFDPDVVKAFITNAPQISKHYIENNVEAHALRSSPPPHASDPARSG